MARADELKRRTERLLAGEKNTRDLDVLFLWLRDRTFGNRAVADVGDFVAHSDERDKGISWRGVQWWFDMMSFHLPRLAKAADIIPATVEEVCAAVLASFELTSPEDVRAQTGIGKKKARQILSKALSAMEGFDGATIIPKRELSPKEQQLFNEYSGRIAFRPAFTANDLTSQFATCLVRNRLADASLGSLPSEVSDFVATYAIEKMHLAHIRLKNGNLAVIEAGICVRDGTSTIDAFAYMDVHPQAATRKIGFPLYQTHLDALKFCAPELLPELPTEVRWDFPLEIGSDGKLRTL